MIFSSNPYPVARALLRRAVNSIRGLLARKVGLEAIDIGHELRLADQREGKADHNRLLLTFELDPQARFVRGYALYHAPEALAPVDQLLQLYLGFMTRP